MKRNYHEAGDIVEYYFNGFVRTARVNRVITSGKLKGWLDVGDNGFLMTDYPCKPSLLQTAGKIKGAL
jgi:hypothetical protein